jgi:hypothetical protein
MTPDTRAQEPLGPRLVCELASLGYERPDPLQYHERYVVTIVVGHARRFDEPASFEDRAAGNG